MNLKTKNTECVSITSEEEVAEYLNDLRLRARTGYALVPLLSEHHAIYRGKGTNQINRIKGYVLASFYSVSLPEEALIYVLEELENSRTAYLTAASAMAIRGMSEKNVHVVPYLLKGIINMRLRDDAVNLDTYAPDWGESKWTTALNELLETLEWMGAYAKEAIPLLTELSEDSSFNHLIRNKIKTTIELILNDEEEVDNCCSITLPEIDSPDSKLDFSFIKQLQVQDQYGEVFSFNDLLKKPTIISFFYTRCTNPNKCALTVSKLGRLHNLLKQKHYANKVNIILFTYDSDFDNPNRLKGYGENKSFDFSHSSKIVRTSSSDFQLLMQYFGLGVNFANSTVSQHTIELFVTDRHGIVKKSFKRLQWKEEEVFTWIQSNWTLLNQGSYFISAFKKRACHGLNTMGASLISLSIAFFPKCPLCWYGYLSVLGISGLKTIPYSPWLFPVLLIFLGLHLLIIFRARKKRNGITPFLFSTIGSLFILLSTLWVEISITRYVGIIFIVLGSLLNSLDFKLYLQLIRPIQRLMLTFIR